MPPSDKLKKPVLPQPPTERVKIQPIVHELKTSYLDYAMSVIVARALPDVRDGMKPVHRRVLYAMWSIGLKPGAKYRKSATVVGECFVKDTLVATDKGLIPIQDIEENDRVYTQNGLQRVTQCYIMPPRPLLKITTRNGLENIVTPSQKFKIIDRNLGFRWKLAHELTVGDFIVSRSIYPNITQYLSLPEFEGKRLFFNEDLAYLLGQFLSDGYYENNGLRGKGRIGFSSSDREIIERIQKILVKIFNYTSRIEQRSQSGQKTMYSIRIQRGNVNAYLEDVFSLRGKKAATKEIPLHCFQSPWSVLFSLFSGLFDGDGSIHNTRRTLQYSTVSQKMAQQLLVIFHELGFPATLRKDRIKEGVIFNGHAIHGNYPPYSLEINGQGAIHFARELTLSSPRKALRLKKIIASESMRTWNVHVNVIPFAAQNVFRELSLAHHGGGWYRTQNGEMFRDGITYSNGTKIRYSADLREKPLTHEQIEAWGIREKLLRIGSPFGQKLNDIHDYHLSFLEVTSVTPHEPDITYDIQVENDHEFIANGMVSHNCLGKYHPHGDQAVYDTIVRMAQDFSLRYPLVDGQGNFGSMDGDSAAAMRYTELRLAKISESILTDIEKDTVNFVPNYDGSHKEPLVLPARLPNLLLNGTVGIAVGMATNIPPHNLRELCDAITHLIDNPEADIDDLMEFVKGPDFPTGGEIFDIRAIKEAYATGKGSIVMRGKADIQEQKGGRFNIVVTEVPFQVNKAVLVSKIAELVRDKKIEGIRDLRDESDKDGVRVVMELKNGAYPKKILNRLFSLTALQTSFHVNMLALVNGIQPQVLTLKNILAEYIKHRENVVQRRTQFELNKAESRAHILEGLKIALLKINEVIETIKKSKDKDVAKENLMKKFRLSELQAQAILEMRLQQLANLERLRVLQELKEIQDLIARLKSILASRKKMLGIIKQELAEIREQFGDDRRTQVFKHAVGKFTQEDLIPKESAIIMLTRDGYIKRLAPDAFKSQGRGGKGVIGLTTKEEDMVEKLLSTNTHADLLFFTTRGRVFQLKAYDVPQTARTAKGQAIVNFLQLGPEEAVSSILSLEDLSQFKYLMMVTRNGVIKKTDIQLFMKIRQSGLIALKIKDGDELRWVQPTSGKENIMLITSKGQAIRFSEDDIRPMGRTASGVRGMRVKDKDAIVGMSRIFEGKSADNELFVIMQNGYGKRTAVKHYKVQNRGGSGIKTANITTKTGDIVGIVSTHTKDERDVIILSSLGQVIRLPLRSVPSLGRATQGVRLMRFKEKNDHVVSVDQVSI